MLIAACMPGALVVYFFHQIPPVSIHEIPEGNLTEACVAVVSSKAPSTSDNSSLI